MRLDEVLKGARYEVTSGNMTTDVSGISYDSRKVKKGYLFIALRGEKTYGRDFIGDAIRRGAAAVIYEHKAEEKNLGFKMMNGGRTFVSVEDGREALACAASNFFGRPSRSLSIAGVTGTNGKTTTTYLIKSILESWGKKVGLIGTIQYMIGDEVSPATHTTPESLEFQGLLRRMVLSGCSHVVSEISSHAIVQKRADFTDFRSGVFTNLTRDHLDFHRTMEEYYVAKERFFRELLADDGVSVINADDPYGRRLVAELMPGRNGRVITYGLGERADIRASEIENSFDGLRFRILMSGEDYEVTSHLTGLPNVYNILSSVGAALSLGVPLDATLEGVSKTGTIRGRFEKVDAGQPFLAVVDYAHTGDALERLIYTARGLTRGKIITVFGCGGDRDRGKRPVMGSIATRLSDFVIITSDNPRSEEPDEIISEVVSGAVRKNYLALPDREEAIKRAVLLAREGDVVLVAGKGHEDYQDIGGRKIRFSDKEVLEEAIRRTVRSE